MCLSSAAVPGRSDWIWDETLFGGSAEHYARGRMPYPEALADALDLDGTERLLDVGCGPGSLTHLLAPRVAEAIGIDADADMVRVAQRDAAPNTRFARLRAEELPADLGTFDVITLAQSFHWFQTDEVARTLYGMLAGDGMLVHVGATTHEGDGNVPRKEIAELVERWLGPEKRAGQGVRNFSDEHPRDVIDRNGFHNRREIEVERDEAIVRSEDDVVASVFSQSFSAPHLFGERVGEFEADLRALLRGRGPFIERPRSITATVWNCA